MGDLMPRPREAARSLRGADPLAPRLPRAVARAVDRESAWGLVNAARAQAVEFVAEARVDAVELVTERAMLGLDRLHRVEAAMAREDPVRSAQFSGLVEDYLMIARSEIRRLPGEL
jgi:hypothetical protein